MIGPQDLWVALGLMLFFFGAKKLPELSRSLGQAVSEFKKGLVFRTKSHVNEHAGRPS
jgi:TatA/E family protein of Tat protein translocase